MRQRRVILSLILALAVVVTAGLFLSAWANQGKSEKDPKPATTFENYRIILNKWDKIQNGVFRVYELRIPLDNEEGKSIRQTVISDLSSHIDYEKAHTYHHELRFRIYYCAGGNARTYKTSYFSESDRIYETPVAELGGESAPPLQALNKSMIDAVCK